MMGIDNSLIVVNEIAKKIKEFNLNIILFIQSPVIYFMDKIYFMQQNLVAHLLNPYKIYLVVEWYCQKVKKDCLANNVLFIRETLKTMFSFRHLMIYRKYDEKELNEKIMCKEIL